ncbi:MAG: DUF1003 domain-containing protein [Burkholderiaceae bacterium]
MLKPEAIARQLLGDDYDKLDEHTRNAARHFANRTRITQSPRANRSSNDRAGQRAADAVARFGGSWTFIGLFVLVLLVWVGLNTAQLTGTTRVFDPYPYILLNLVLSMLAAIQAPIILMSNNRQSEKDRMRAEHDYEVNLKAELEIMLLHEKFDQLRQQQWTELLALQHQQMDQLAALLDTAKLTSQAPDQRATVPLSVDRSATGS